MRVDAQTLHDLEIFDGQAGAPGLFDILDRTRTRPGRDALRRRFLDPPGDPQAIRDVQDSLRFILRHRSAFDLLPPDAVLADVHRYLRSNILPLVANGGARLLLEVLWTRLTYRDVYQEAAAGVYCTAGLLARLARFSVNPAIRGATGELARLLDELHSRLADQRLAEVTAAAGARRSALWVLQADRQLRTSLRPQLVGILELVGEIDALLSMAVATHELGLVLPEVTAGAPMIVAEGIRHPFLPASVPNTLDLASDRLLLITGPNMAGKTTFLRACGITAYLAHLGMGVPACTCRFAPFDALLTTISLTDDVRAGVSFFRAEALRMREVARAAVEGHVLAVLDEPFKGTNVKDAIDASRMVLSAFAGAAGSAFLVASHLIELAAVLEPLPGVGCYRFEADESAPELQFDFTLRPGISEQRLGSRVLAEEGVFELLARLPAAVPVAAVVPS